MARGWMLLFGFAVMPSAEALQCRNIIAVADESPIVFVARPVRIPARGAVVPQGLGAEIRGAPAAHDLVRFELHEVLKGSLPGPVDMLCPHDVCRIGDSDGPLVIALAEPPGMLAQATILCRWTYLTPSSGWPTAPELSARIARWRAERAEAKLDADIWRSS